MQDKILSALEFGIRMGWG